MMKIEKPSIEAQEAASLGTRRSSVADRPLERHESPNKYSSSTHTWQGTWLEFEVGRYSIHRIPSNGVATTHRDKI
jgi:hypothetical protein